jgi:hypothetical protein
VWAFGGAILKGLTAHAIERDFGRSRVDAVLSVAEALPGRARVYRRLMFAWTALGFIAALAAAYWFHFHPDV